MDIWQQQQRSGVLSNGATLGIYAPMGDFLESTFRAARSLNAIITMAADSRRRFLESFFRN